MTDETSPVPIARVTQQNPDGKPVEMIPQPHGGALKRGGTRSPGRPANSIRRRLRGDFAQRLDILRGIADGTVEVNLLDVCEYCHLPPSKPQRRDWIDDVLKRVRAAVSEQLKALDLMAKYGMGTMKAVSDDEIRQRLAETLEKIRNSPHVTNPEALIAELEPTWR